MADPRIVSGTVDIGAYEFQPGTSGSFIGWLQQYGLPTDGSADYADSDHDGMNNWLEFCTGTNPTNSLSALRLVSVTRNGSGLTVTWQSVTNQTYFLERSIGLRGYPSFLTVATNLPGQWTTTTYTDTNAAGRGPFFYRVGVQPAGWQMPSGGSIISYAWLQQYGLPTDGSADHADPDHDGLNNWQEWRGRDHPHKRRFGAADVVGHRHGFRRDRGLVKRRRPIVFAGAGSQPGRVPSLLAVAQQHRRPDRHHELDRYQRSWRCAPLLPGPRGAIATGRASVLASPNISGRK